MRIAVISSVYGGYDQPAPHAPQDADAEYVLVSDRAYDCPPWRTVAEPRPQLHPRLAAKFAKCRPDLYADADVYVWCDANVRVLDPGFLRWCLACAGDADIAVSRHPDAPRVSDDMAIAMSQARFSSLPMREQVAHYGKEGFREDFGNWWTGLMVRRGRAAEPGFGDAWLSEMVRWTNHDQISLPYVLWRHGIRPADMPPGWAEGRFTFSAHGPEHVMGAAR
jgi:Protein of unknown function (DUF616)